MKDAESKEDFTELDRIGTSKFFFNVWYKITNPKALVPCGYCGNGWNMDSSESPTTYFVGDYSREKFNSVKFELSIYKSPLWESRWDVSVLCFADTRECGADTIVHLTTNDIHNIDKRLFDYTSEVLSRSGAIVDMDLNQEEITYRKESIVKLQAYNDKLARIMQIAKACQNLKASKATQEV